MNEQEFNPTEQNNVYGGYQQTEELEQPVNTETYQQPQPYEGDPYQQAPQQSVYQEYAYQMPVASKSPKVRQKGNPVTMLIMSFITFICMVMLPWISFPQVKDVSVHATDILKIGIIGVGAPDISEGAVGDSIARTIDENIAREEDPTSKELLIKLKAPVVEFFQTSTSGIVKVLAALKVIGTVIMVGVSLMAIFWILIIIAAAKGMKKLYNIFNILIAIFFAAIVVLFLIIGGSQYIGVGVWSTLAMLIASSVVCSFSKPKEIATPVM